MRWIEAHCRVPEGRDVGKPVRLRKWQRDIVRGIYDTPTRRAIISFGRKNAKTTLSAFLLLLHLCGPEARANGQLYSAAQSRDQAGILFALATKVVRMSPTLHEVVTVRESAKTLVCSELGTLYRALSADASTAYGLSPVFVVHDELGQVRGPRSELYDALETAVGAQEAPLSVVISTQAPTDADLLSVLIDDAAAGHDPRTKLWLWTADKELDPFGVAARKAANPALGDFLNADEVAAMAEEARRMPSREAQFRNLVLNQRVEARSPFISREVWAACSDPPRSLVGRRVWGGLDLSSTSDLTALVLIAPDGEAFDVVPTFWLPEAGLAEKSRADRVPYDVWAAGGYLETTPGAAIEYEWIARRLRDVFDDYEVEQLAFDRWAFRHLRPWLVKAGFTEEELARFVEFGQGFQSMSPALRDLEAAILGQRLRHGAHPVLTMCMANAVVQTDPAGNRKLNKARASGRIDGAVALAMAFGVAPMEAEVEPGPGPISWGDDRRVLVA